MSTNITWNVIGNLTSSTLNFTGIIFAVVCVGGLFLFARTKKIEELNLKDEFKKFLL